MKKIIVFLLFVCFSSFGFAMQPRYITAEQFEQERNTLLIDAVLQGNVDNVKYWLNCHARICVLDEKGKSALHYAAMVGRPGILRQLISGSLSGSFFVDIRTGLHNLTPLQIAVFKGHLEATAFLIFQGASLTVVTSYVLSLFDIAKNNNDENMYKLLWCARYREKSIDKNLPLHEAVRRGYNTIVKVLLEVGFDRNEEDSCGNKPIFYARQNKNNFLISLLQTRCVYNEQSNLFNQSFEETDSSGSVSSSDSEDDVEMGMSQSMKNQNSSDEEVYTAHSSQRNSNFGVHKSMRDEGQDVDPYSEEAIHQEYQSENKKKWEVLKEYGHIYYTPANTITQNYFDFASWVRNSEVKRSLDDYGQGT